MRSYIVGMRARSIGRRRTCDSFPTVNDRQDGECVSNKGAIFEGRKIVVRGTSLDMVVPQVFPQVPKGVTETERSQQVQGADIEAQPGERRQRCQRILVQRNDRLKTHDLAEWECRQTLGNVT